MSEPLVTFARAIQLAERGFATWADKPHNKKWARKIDGTPIKNDLCVNIALAIMNGLRDDLPDERQNRIFRLERRIHYQRQQLHTTSEIIEDRSCGWMGSPAGRRRFHALLKRQQELNRELSRLKEARSPLWKRVLRLT